jgi:hypothetical protein
LLPTLLCCTILLELPMLVVVVLLLLLLLGLWLPLMIVVTNVATGIVAKSIAKKSVVVVCLQFSDHKLHKCILFRPITRTTDKKKKHEQTHGNDRYSFDTTHRFTCSTSTPPTKDVANGSGAAGVANSTGTVGTAAAAASTTFETPETK